jgi:hypothetical protein
MALFLFLIVGLLCILIVEWVYEWKDFLNI